MLFMAGFLGVWKGTLIETAPRWLTGARTIITYARLCAAPHADASRLVWTLGRRRGPCFGWCTAMFGVIILLLLLVNVVCVCVSVCVCVGRQPVTSVCLVRATVPDPL